MHDRETRLLGREAELALISQDLLAVAQAGDGCLVVVEGPAGIGKSALLAAACGCAGASGLRVLNARGGRLERDFAFGVVRQLLGRERLPPLARDLVAASRDRNVSVPVGGVVLEELYSVLAGVADRGPLLVCVDDAHFADVLSLHLLAYVARRLEGLPVGLLLAGDVGGPRDCELLLDELRFGPRAVRVTLLSLDADAVAAIVRSRLPDADDAFCGECQRSSGGHPLYLRELLDLAALERVVPAAANAAWVAGASPLAVAAHVLARVQQVSVDAPRLLEAIAVLGDGARLDHAAALAEVDLPVATGIACALVRAGVLASDEPLAFTYPVVQRAIYARLSPRQADAARRGAAELLLKGDAPLEQVGPHLIAMSPGGRQWVVQALRDCAQQAIARGTPETAVRYLRRALDEPPAAAQRSAVLGALGFAEDQAGLPTAVDRFREALTLASDRTEQSGLTLALALTLISRHRLTDATEVVDGALADCGGLAPQEAQRLEAALIAASMIDPERLLRTLPRLERLSRLTPDSPVGRAALAALALGGAFTNASRERIVSLARDALADTALAADTWGTDVMAIHACFLAEEFATARALLTRALARGRADGNVRQWVWALQHLAELSLSVGSVREADDLSRQLVEALTDWDDPLARSSGCASRIEILVERGDLRAAQAMLVEATAIMEGPLEDWAGYGGFRRLLAARGRLRLAQHRVVEAAGDLVACVRKAQQAGIEVPLGYGCGADAAVAARLAGDDLQASALAHRELERAQAFGAPRALGVALRAAALADPDADRQGLLRESVTLLEGSPARLEYARSLLELGAQLRRANQRREARELLGFCYEFAHRVGADAMKHRAHVELNAAGLRPRRIAPSGVQALTACELRVAQLAAAGRANPEIARILNVTAKTVETHLSHTYTKLGISGRGARARLPTLLASTTAESSGADDANRSQTASRGTRSP